MPSRRNVLGLTGAAVGAAALGRTAANDQALAARDTGHKRGRTRVLLLGTLGGPGASPGLDGDRAGIGSYVEVDGVGYVVDFGNGTLLSMQRLGLDTVDMSAAFLTHIHSDHDYDYASILYNKWARRVAPVWDVYGPRGLARLTQDSFKYFSLDAASRYSEGGYPVKWQRKYVNVHEFDSHTDVMQARTKGEIIHADQRVTVSAIPVNHPPLPTLAYRFDTPDLSVAFSGDTADNDTLWRLAEGADILVHEAIYIDALREVVDNEKKLQHILNVHSTPEQAGATASKAGVPMLVLTHLFPGNSEVVADSKWHKAAAKTYGGEILVGHDLLNVT